MNPHEFSVNASVMSILPSGPGSIQMDPTMLHAPEHHYTMAVLQDIARDGEAYSTILPAPSTVPLDRSTVRKSPNEEEMEDAEESPEWAVRVGDAPPPAWGKRKASDDERDVNKKGRFHR
jgi:hypothetical protein